MFVPVAALGPDGPGQLRELPLGGSPRLFRPESRLQLLRGSLPFCHIHLKAPKPLPAAYPRELTTIGSHIRKRRLDLGLLQRQVAKQLGVDKSTVNNWEVGATQPMIRCISRIIRFLGYNPFPPAGTIAEQIVCYRRTQGLPREQLAKHLGIDPGTLWRWEAGIREPKGKFLKIVKVWLAGSTDWIAGNSCGSCLFKRA